MEWTKAIIKTSCKNSEVISALLIDLGIFGTEIIDPNERSSVLSGSSNHWDYVDDSLLQPYTGGDEVTIIFYLGTDKDSLHLLEHVQSALTKQSFEAASTPTSLTTEIVNDEDWLHEWKNYYHPIQIGRVLIVPEWEALPKKGDDIVSFTINPGSAFGTGQHATTALCIDALQKIICSKDTILDIGCGSGILSIISLLLGAKEAIGVDIDPAAVETTKRNASLNPIPLDSLNILTGDILTCANLQSIIRQRKFNIVIANIVADIIIDLMPFVSHILIKEGVFISSGIISERLDDVLKSFSAAGFSIIETKEAEGWYCVVATNG